MLTLRALMLAFISCLSLAEIFCLLALCRVFLSSRALFCRAALLRVLIFSFCSVVNLFRRALSRSRLARFLSSEMFAIGCLCSAITVTELPVISLTCLLPEWCTTFRKLIRHATRWATLYCATGQSVYHLNLRLRVSRCW